MPKLSTKHVSQRREEFLASWREYAPEAAFAGYTLEQFETESDKPLEVRTRMTRARSTLAGLKLERAKTDDAYMQMLVAVANGVRADPIHGLDSPLYRSLGFVPRSERKRPRRRASSTNPPAEDADAA